MDYPKTKDEWWQQLDHNWKNVIGIILMFYPFTDKYVKTDSDHPGVAQAPQAACNTVIAEIVKSGRKKWDDQKAFIEHLEGLRNDRSPEIDKIMQETWFGIPESRGSRYLPGFQEFCDLCSESYLLYD